MYFCSHHPNVRDLQDSELEDLQSIRKFVKGYLTKTPKGMTSTTTRRLQLSDLPNELLTQILSNIRGQSNLAKIALLSKQFKTLVERLLYHHISLDVQYSAEDFSNTRFVNMDSYTTIPSFVPFDRLINKLSVRLDLGRSVRRLDLRVRRRLWYMPFDAHSRLLECLPELQALSLDPPPLHLSMPCSDGPLKSLRLNFSHVTDHYGEGRTWFFNGVPLQIIARHLLLAKLRKLHVEMGRFVPNFDYTHHLPAGSSSVEDLLFLNCRVKKCDSVLASFLRSTKRLKRFVIEFWLTPYLIASPAPSAGVFERALSAHQETIEELAVATSGGLAEIRWALAPFTQWSSLKRLAVPRNMILGDPPRLRYLHTILPPLLEEFQVQHKTENFHRIVPQMPYEEPLDWLSTDWTHSRDGGIDVDRILDISEMRILAANKETHIPKLKHVVWWYQTHETSSQDYHDYSLDRTEVLLQEASLAFEEVGVEFMWITGSLFKNTPFGRRLYEWQE